MKLARQLQREKIPICIDEEFALDIGVFQNTI